jgi:hypothetical protein
LYHCFSEASLKLALRRSTQCRQIHISQRIGCVPMVVSRDCVC